MHIYLDPDGLFIFCPPLDEKGTDVGINFSRRFNIIMRILKAQCNSRRRCVLYLILLWVVVYLVSLGSYISAKPIMLLGGIPGAIMLGWLFLPASLVHNLTGWTGENVPAWISWGIAAYWLTVLGLTVTFMVSRRWIVLAVLTAVLLLSAKGCYHFADIQDWTG